MYLLPSGVEPYLLDTSDSSGVSDDNPGLL